MPFRSLVAIHIESAIAEVLSVTVSRRTISGAVDGRRGFYQTGIRFDDRTTIRQIPYDPFADSPAEIGRVSLYDGNTSCPSQCHESQESHAESIAYTHTKRI